MKVKMQSLDGKASGDIELPEEIFGLEARPDILHRVVTWQLANRRGMARAARERGDVARTSKKFGRQKGGGGARHGSRKAPIFVGGGKAHGPKARTFEQSLNKKVRVLGLKTALSVKAAEGKLVVLKDLDLKDAKTKALKESLGKLGFERALFIDAETNEGFKKAAANLPHIDVLPTAGANVYDILNHDTLVLTKAAVEKLEARFNG
ncbi:50S ribosomal protein L4 [Pacificimonas flava]|uniref:Large ribosomal subunit protein uL4 n=1 Tax=Pacificimonas flava TaxID=1234595 RepID=M2T6Y9_9SPHN|nr:50S ribosomal protein L4 [Pacificimonas flava]EMD82294.1 LSU ribosomal protein L4p (L1e) [Pacificimonas flava]MBB5280798.1 large subunit ribosomal protein L4 [Pacificimonas flava]